MTRNGLILDYLICLINQIMLEEESDCTFVFLTIIPLTAITEENPKLGVEMSV